MENEVTMAEVYAAAIRQFRRELMTATDMEQRLSLQCPERERFTAMSNSVRKQFQFACDLYQAETGESFFSDEI